eukprot:gene8576-11588_t
MKILFVWTFVSLVIVTVAGQLYGAYNCNGNNYCGPQPPACTEQQNAAALSAFYDGTIPPFTFIWNGSPSLIPIANTYVGSMALAEFFGLVNSDVTGFTFYQGFAAPADGGLLVTAYNCQFIVAQWQEISKVIGTGKPITKATNTVVYSMLNYSYPYIAQANVFVNDGQYQDAFCSGQVSCNGSSSSDYYFPILVTILVLIVWIWINLQVMWYRASIARGYWFYPSTTNSMASQESSQEMTTKA